MANHFYLEILNLYFIGLSSPVKQYFFDFILKHYQLNAKIVFEEYFVIHSYYF